jgi:hypothetical protein
MKRQVRVAGRLLAAGSVLVLVASALANALMASAASPTTVVLGTASTFGVLAGSAITNTGLTVVNGDLASDPTPSISGFPPGTVNGTKHTVVDAVTTGAKADLVTAYNDAELRGPKIPIVGDLGGQTLTPGVYNSASSIGLTGALTLSGTAFDVWIIQAGSTLTTASASSVVLSGGAQACNVFWQVGSSATLGTGTTFRGSILALTSITVTTGATIDGRALALNGAVTLDTNRITTPACAGPPTLTTVASGSTTVGGTIHDTATVSGGVSPTGTVSFSLYGPGDTTCATSIGATANVALSGGTATSASFTTTTVGTYRFVATYNGDANNNPVTSACSDAAEQITTTRATPTLATVAGGSTTVGGSINDTATVAGGVSPSGTVSFTLYGPGDTTCTTAIGTSPNVALSGGTATSANFTTASLGRYRFVASYSGDANNNAVTSSCADIAEQITTIKATPTLATVASGSTTVGGTIHDVAAVSGGVSPSGTVSFTLFGPGDTTCTTPIGTSANVALSGGIATSVNFTTTSLGTYRFVAEYNGDANNNAGTSACSDAAEQITTTKATPTLATMAGGSTTVGGQIRDTATVSGGVSPSGTVSFTLYGPGDTSCATPISTSPNVALSAGSATSANFTTASLGTYRFVAMYSGDANNNTVSSACADSAEQITTGKATPTLATLASGSTTVGGTIDDTATVSGGISPTGTLAFTLYGPGDTTCTTPIGTSSNVALSGGTATSVNFTTTGFGTYRFIATYSGDANNNAVTSSCADTAEQVNVVNKATPTLATLASGSTAAGGMIHDTATVSGGASPTGTVSFTLYGPGDTTCTTAIGTNPNVALSGGTAASANFTTTTLGTYRFVVTYSGDANNNAVTSACSDAAEQITVTTKATPTLATVASGSATVGGQIRDTATVSGGVAPSGTVAFNLYGPGDTTCLTSIGTSTNPLGVATVTSANFTTTSVGIYRFVAAYNGDANNTAVSTACGDTGEQIAVTTMATATPTANPTATATPLPTGTPTATPTQIPASTPTAAPTAGPTAAPAPIEGPTPGGPSSLPSASPTAAPTKPPGPASTPTAAPRAVLGVSAAPAPRASPSGVRASLPSTSTRAVDNTPTWVFVLSLALFTLLTWLARARGRWPEDLAPGLVGAAADMHQ